MHRSEGAFIWLAYFTVFFAAMYFVKKPQHARFILYSLFFSSAIMSVIGVSQFMGRNFFNTELARWLITAGTSAKGISPAFKNANGMLIHHNTFGKYAAMLTPILLLGALAYNGKKLVNLLLLAVGGLMLLCVFGSKSLGGLIGIIAAVAVCILCGILHKKQKRDAIPRRFFDKRFTIMMGGAAGALLLSILLITPINKHVTLLFSRLGNTVHGETDTVEDYFFQDDTMSVYQGSDRQFSLTVHGLATDGWLTVRDGNGQEVPYSHRQEISLEEVPDHPLHHILEGAASPVRYIFDVPGYRNITIERTPKYFVYYYRYLTPSSKYFAYYYHHSSPLILTLQDGRIFGISLNGDLIDLSVKIPAWGFYGRETWGTQRGYIWSRSFPLFPSRTFIGSGPDTFATSFPQQDMVGKMRFFRDPYIVVDLSQNVFIRTWITTGGISALALFALFGHYIVTTFWSLVKTKDEPVFTYRLRLGLLAGISAFCISSMSTDSTIGSTGVFFVLLGLGYGINDIVIKSE